MVRNEERLLNSHFAPSSFVNLNTFITLSSEGVEIIFTKSSHFFASCTEKVEVKKFLKLYLSLSFQEIFFCFSSQSCFIRLSL